MRARQERARDYKAEQVSSHAPSVSQSNPTSKELLTSRLFHSFTC